MLVKQLDVVGCPPGRRLAEPRLGFGPLFTALPKVIHLLGFLPEPGLMQTGPGSGLQC